MDHPAQMPVSSEERILKELNDMRSVMGQLVANSTRSENRNPNPKAKSYQHGGKPAKQNHAHKAMSATTTKSRRRKRKQAKPSSPSSSSSEGESDTEGDVQYAFLARAQVYGEIPDVQDGNEGEVFDLYARNTKTADKRVETLMEQTEDPSPALSEMTTAELQEHIGSLHQLLTAPVFDMAEPSEPQE